MGTEKEKLPQGPASGKFFDDNPMTTPPVKKQRNTGKNEGGSKLLQENQTGKSNPDSRNT